MSVSYVRQAVYEAARVSSIVSFKYRGRVLRVPFVFLITYVIIIDILLE